MIVKRQQTVVERKANLSDFLIEFHQTHSHALHTRLVAVGLRRLRRLATLLLLLHASVHLFLLLQMRELSLQLLILALVRLRITTSRQVMVRSL